MIDLSPSHLETVMHILAEQVPECEVRAFGSRVTWTAKDYSDLDLAVVGESALDRDALRRLTEAFEESALPFRVDVLDWNAISPAFRKVIEEKFEVVQKGDQRSLGAAGERWTQMPLGKFVSLQRGHDLPDDQRQPGHVPILGSFGITGWHDAVRARGPGVTVGRSGASFGVVCYSPIDYWPLNTALFVTDFHGNDARFAYYLLKHFDFRSYNSGSAQPSLNRNFVHPVPVDVPPVAEQRAIAHILGTLDDKIELNRRMNGTLEAMARALFKSWFVDFDPVRAKAEGRDPGLPQPLADLFPDSFEDSDLGEIPKGWEVRRLGDLLELAYGKALKAEDRHGGDVPVFGSNGLVGWHDERLAAGPGIVVGRKGNPGVATWAPTDFFAIDTAFFVVPKAVCRSAHFLFHVLQSHDLASLGADSAVPGLNRNLAYMSTQVLPPQRLLDKFDSCTNSLASRIHDCSEESRTLAALRDTLLPKLIAGELRVENVEKFVGEQSDG